MVAGIPGFLPDALSPGEQHPGDLKFEAAVVSELLPDWVLDLDNLAALEVIEPEEFHADIDTGAVGVHLLPGDHLLLRLRDVEADAIDLEVAVLLIAAAARG